MRGPQVMQGYWHRHDESKLVLTEDGWLHTGDIGAFDADGYLKILDRKKDMVNVSGFKVFPNEVEDVMAQHPGVLESAVIGVADPHTGQGVKLFVVKRDPALSEADLRKFARERLAAYKVPKVIVFVELVAQEQCRQDHPQRFAVTAYPAPRSGEEGPPGEAGRWKGRGPRGKPQRRAPPPPCFAWSPSAAALRSAVEDEDTQCAISTGRFAFVRICRVVPPKIICRKRLCV